MVMRRCPQCKTTTDDQFGFCIKCGYEFPKNTQDANKVCIKCGSENPAHAVHCVKCGAPLEIGDMENILKNFDVLIKPSKNKENANDVFIKPTEPVEKTSRILIILGYVFSIIGGVIGLIISIYLITRKDPVAKKHGSIQLAINCIVIILTLVFLLSGQVDPQTYLEGYRQLLNGNMSSFNSTGFYF